MSAKQLLLALKDVQASVTGSAGGVATSSDDFSAREEAVTGATASFGCHAVTPSVTQFLRQARLALKSPSISPCPSSAPLSGAVAAVKEHVAIERYCSTEGAAGGWGTLGATVSTDAQLVGAAHGSAVLLTEWGGSDEHGSHVLALVWRPGVTSGNLIAAKLRVRVDDADGTVYGALLGGPADAEVPLAEWVAMLVPAEVLLWQTSAASTARPPIVADLMAWSVEAELRCYRWWHPSWSRTEAERHLTVGNLLVGTFVVRRSSQPNTLALTHVTVGGLIDHALIHVRGQGVAFSMEQTTEEYPTLIGLLETYGVLLVQQRVADADGVTVTHLRVPANRAEAEAAVRSSAPPDAQKALLEQCAMLA